MPSVRIDPELTRQLDAAGSSDHVEALLYLRAPGNAPFLEDPRTVESLSRELVDRVEREVGYRADQVNIFGYLATFFVAARAEFIKGLLAQPEIASAAANVPQARERAAAGLDNQELEVTTSSSTSQ